MQHHSAAILLAYINIGESTRFRVTGENKSYDLTVRRASGDKIEIEVGNTWKCYSEIFTQDKGSHLSIEIRHPSESSTTIDVIELYKNGDFKGKFYSTNRAVYPFSGKIYSNNSDIQGQLLNKQGKTENFRFRLQ